MGIYRPIGVDVGLSNGHVRRNGLNAEVTECDIRIDRIHYALVVEDYVWQPQQVAGDVKHCDVAVVGRLPGEPMISPLLQPPQFYIPLYNRRQPSYVNEIPRSSQHLVSFLLNVFHRPA